MARCSEAFRVHVLVNNHSPQAVTGLFSLYSGWDGRSWRRVAGRKKNKGIVIMNIKRLETAGSFLFF